MSLLGRVKSCYVVVRCSCRVVSYRGPNASCYVMSCRIMSSGGVSCRERVLSWTSRVVLKSVVRVMSCRGLVWFVAPCGAVTETNIWFQV